MFKFGVNLFLKFIERKTLSTNVRGRQTSVIVSPFAKLSTEEVSVLSKNVSNHMKLDELSPFQNLDEIRNSKVVDGEKDSNCICRAP